jgi:hypothetical protein
MMIFWLLKCSQGVYLKAGSHRNQEIKRRSSLQQIIWNFTVKVARKSRSFRLTIINNYESSLAIPIFCHDPIAQLPCPLPRVPYKTKQRNPITSRLHPSNLVQNKNISKKSTSSSIPPILSRTNTKQLPKYNSHIADASTRDNHQQR